MKVRIKDIKYIRKLEWPIVELAASIKEIGLRVPITVTMDRKLIDGLCRLKAMESLGHEEIECEEVILTDEQIMEIQISPKSWTTTTQDYIKQLKKRSLGLDKLLIDAILKQREQDNSNNVPVENRVYYVTEEQYDHVRKILGDPIKLFGYKLVINYKEKFEYMVYKIELLEKDLYYMWERIKELEQLEERVVQLEEQIKIL